MEAEITKEDAARLARELEMCLWCMPAFFFSGAAFVTSWFVPDGRLTTAVTALLWATTIALFGRAMNGSWRRTIRRSASTPLVLVILLALGYFLLFRG